MANFNTSQNIFSDSLDWTNIGILFFKIVNKTFKSLNIQ